MGGDGPIEFLDSHDRPLVDEQSRDFDGVLECSASVGSEVENHGIDFAIGVERFECLADISSRTAKIGDPASFGVEVAIERRHVDHADPAAGSGNPLAGVDNDRGDGRLFQLDDLPGQFIDLRFAGLGGLDLQPDLGVLLASDQPNDPAEFHLDNVLDVAFLLADSDDLVTQLQPAVLVGGAAGDDGADDGESVLAAESRADPLQPQPHADIEILASLGRHVAGVRIEAVGHRREVPLQDLGPIGLLGESQHVDVAFAELLAGLGQLGVIENLGEQFGLDPFPPAFVEFFGRAAPIEEFGVGDTGLVDGEVVLGLDVRRRQLGLPTDSLEIALVHGKGELDVSLEQLVVELRLELLESLDVLLDEVQLQRVDRFDVPLESLPGDVVVDFLLADVEAVDQLADHLGRLLVLGGLVELLGTDRPTGQQ